MNRFASGFGVIFYSNYWITVILDGPMMEMVIPRFCMKIFSARIVRLYFLHYENKNCLQFLFIVKAAVLKQQISKFYPQIQRTEDSDHIYFSQRPFINVKAIFCV